MTEKIRYSPEGWTFYGEDFGGKVEGLLAFKELNIPGLEVTPGIAIGASYFREFVRINGFDQNNWRGEVLEGGVLPNSLDHVNRKILSSIQVGTCFAIRSSVIGENAGVGVYSSYFMVRTPDIEADMITLGNYQKLIYSDFFTADSQAFLGVGLSDPEVGGVGLLIQPVIGDRYGELLMPAISGVATTVNGELTLRLVLGLGTKAVEMSEAIVLKGENLNLETIEKVLYLTTSRCDALNNLSQIRPLLLEKEMKKRMSSQTAKLGEFLGHWKNLFESGSPHYAEFAISRSRQKLQILQIHPEAAEALSSNEIGPLTGRLLCDSHDVVNQGVRQGKGIFVLGLNGPEPDDLSHLAVFNERNNGYLLILSDIHFSRGNSTNKVSLSHFSNAAGVIEAQRVPTKDGSPYMGEIDHINRGGSHFTHLCKSRDVLFQGVPVHSWDDSMIRRLGDQYQRVGRLSAYFDLEFKMINVTREGRTVIFGEPQPKEYTRESFSRWIDELRETAEILTETDIVTSNSFYLVANHMIRALGSTVANYDPFGFTKNLSRPDLVKCSAALGHVLEDLHYTESYEDYREGLSWGITEEGGNVFELREYLLKLQSQVKKRLAML